jgi:hypothetical protein
MAELVRGAVRMHCIYGTATTVALVVNVWDLRE